MKPRTHEDENELRFFSVFASSWLRLIDGRDIPYFGMRDET